MLLRERLIDRADGDLDITHGRHTGTARDGGFVLGGPRPARVPRAGLPDSVSVPRAGEARGPSCSPPALVPVPRAHPSRSLSIRTVNPLETLSRWPPHASHLPGPSAQPVGAACTAPATSPAPRPGPGSQHATERAWSRSPMSTSSPGPAPVLGLSPPAPPAGGPSRAGRLCLPEHALPAAPAASAPAGASPAFGSTIFPSPSPAPVPPLPQLPAASQWLRPPVSCCLRPRLRSELPPPTGQSGRLGAGRPGVARTQRAQRLPRARLLVAPASWVGPLPRSCCDPSFHGPQRCVDCVGTTPDGPPAAPTPRESLGLHGFRPRAQRTRCHAPSRPGPSPTGPLRQDSHPPGPLVHRLITHAVNVHHAPARVGHVPGTSARCEKEGRVSSSIQCEETDRKQINTQHDDRSCRGAGRGRRGGGLLWMGSGPALPGRTQLKGRPGPAEPGKDVRAAGRAGRTSSGAAETRPPQGDGGRTSSSCLRGRNRASAG